MDENEEIQSVMGTLSKLVDDEIYFKDDDIRVVGRSALFNPANLGRFYFFYYRPATAKKLPYYTLFPAMASISIRDQTFVGANLFYVEEKTRKPIFDFFKRYQSQTDGFPRSIFRYDRVKEFRLFRSLLTPTIKQYRINRISSKVIEISPAAYDKFFMGAMGEVLQKGFVKRGYRAVQFESRMKILKALLNR